MLVNLFFCIKYLKCVVSCLKQDKLELGYQYYHCINILKNLDFGLQR